MSGGEPGSAGVSEFLLVGTRSRAPGELPLAVVAHDLVALATWHAWLRRWGLLRSFGLPRDPVADLRACLVVRATGEDAARRLAAGWGRVSGYRVTVLPLSGGTAGEGGGP